MLGVFENSNETPEHEKKKNKYIQVHRWRERRQGIS
jgi:hypothetical protein